MSSCNFTTPIDREQCIGDSRVVINSNFDNLDTAVCALSTFMINIYPVGVIKVSMTPMSYPWVFCDGAELSQSTYPALYSVLGNTFGAASVGYFKIPDIKDKYIKGASSSSTAGVTQTLYNSGSATLVGISFLPYIKVI